MTCELCKSNSPDVGYAVPTALGGGLACPECALKNGFAVECSLCGKIVHVNAATLYEVVGGPDYRCLSCIAVGQAIGRGLDMQREIDSLPAGPAAALLSQVRIAQALVPLARLYDHKVDAVGVISHEDAPSHLENGACMQALRSLGIAPTSISSQELNKVALWLDQVEEYMEEKRKSLGLRAPV